MIMKSDDEILKELQRSTTGLMVMSESDYPFEVVGIESNQKLSHDALRKLAGSNADETIVLGDVDSFFRTSVSEPEWKNESQVATARRFQNVVKILKEELSDVRVYKIGKIDISVLILGKSPQGNWLGLSTRVIET
jgi:hypothetical protein